MLYATRHYMNQRTFLDKTVPYSPAAGHLIYPNGLLISPGHYKSYIVRPEGMFHCALDCTQPGLYQIFIPATEVGGSIAYIYYFINGSTPLGLASAVAHMHAFGTSDDGLSVAGKIQKMRYSPLSMQCGSSAQVLYYLALSCGYEARYCYILTHDTPNGYSDGHTLAEIKVNGRWCAFDTSLNFVMQNPGSNNLLSIAEACEGVWAGTTQFHEIAPFQFDAQTTVLGGWNQWGWCMAEALYDDVERANAARRLFRIPLIADPDESIWGYLPPGSEGQASYAAQLGYNITSRSAFMAKYYGA